MRIHSTSNVLNVLNQHLVAYPTPVNLNYMYNWGSLAGIMLSLQIITGFFLAMHYVPSTSMAFDSVIHLMNDVPSGMILRYAHANGASIFFIVVYMHILRGIYYNSGNQPRELVWITGVIILLVMIVTAFIGYVLPWGSFWGATVITSLVTVIPVIGKSIVYWLWGGFSIDHPTLNRFYSFHYMLPFILAALSLFHIASLHQYGSTNPLGVNSSTNTIPFGIYFTGKDFLGFLFLVLFYGILVFFYPEWLGHPDNLIPANPYATPQHIVPEWYFLWVYAILRSIPNKAMGALLILIVFVSLIGLPLFTLGYRNVFNDLSNVKSFRLISERFYWVFVSDVFLLSWLGGQEIMPATIFLGQICTFVLLFYLLIVYPLLPLFENHLYKSVVFSRAGALEKTVTLSGVKG